MDTDKTLSEIARSVLTGNPAADPGSLREKAGLLALLNLLGIVESFYGEGNAVRTSMNLIRSIAERPTSVERPKEPDLASSVMSLATKLLSGSQGEPQETSPSSSQGSLDPALISTLIGAMSAMSKSRGQAPRPGKASEAGPDQCETDKSPDDDGEGAAGSESVTDGEEVSAKTEKLPQNRSAPSPPSTLQQILGIDPRIITLALNVLADLMKSRGAGPSEKHESGAATSPPEGIERLPGPFRERNQPAADIVLASGGDTAAVPTARKQKLYHKPGLGIYRQRAAADE